MCLLDAHSVLHGRKIVLIEHNAAAASERKSGGGHASLDVEQLALALTPDPQDQEQFPELHNVRPPPVSIPCLSVSVLCLSACLSRLLCVCMTA